MTKVVDEPGIPGGNPDRPTKFGQGPECTTPGCKRASRQQGLCNPCNDDHVSERAKEPTTDQWNEALDRARDS